MIRVYYVPPKWFLDLCEEFRLRALISIPWSEHLEFLNDRKVRRDAERAVAEGVGQNAGHTAVFGYLVGNEIPSTMVRWLGPRQVTEFVENLINIGREEDDSALFSYASYPPTEYLLPQNSDFVTFNVYLHRQSDFESYLARLQNLAEEKPLLLGEFGMDTIRHSEEDQAEMLRWHIESVVRGGLAGTIIYAWTDEWFRGGQEITDWAFGLVRRDRTPKTLLLDSQGTLRRRRLDDSQGQTAPLSKGFRRRLFIQWRQDARSMPRIAATARISRLRSDPR